MFFELLVNMKIPLRNHWDFFLYLQSKTNYKMKSKLLILITFTFAINNLFSQSHHIINVSGMTFTPDTLVCFVGDTVTINPGGYHNGCRS